MIGLLTLIICLLLLILGVTTLKMHPIPILLISGLILGLFSGSSVTETTDSLLNGFGGTLKWIGLVILFGTLLGEILSETGGADVIADTIIGVFGIKYLPLSIAVIGFLVGIPIFVDVAYLTLLPTILVLSKKSGHSVLVLGLSLAISLEVAHALIPPTPGPLVVAALLEVDIGKIIPLNVMVALTAISGGLIWIRYNKDKLRLKLSASSMPTTGASHIKLMGVKRLIPFMGLLAPLMLMSLGALLPFENSLMQFIKNPIWALMIGVVIVLPLLQKKEFSNQLTDLFKRSGEKSASVILITGAGGAFGQVIKDSQVINSLFANSSELATFGIILPFLLSLFFTSVTGSITVSLITTSSIVAPLVSNGTLQPEITASAIGAGSLGIIHVNSSFFWLFKEVHVVSTARLLKTFSLLTGIIALSGGALILFVYYFFN